MTKKEAGNTNSVTIRWYSNHNSSTEQLACHHTKLPSFVRCSLLLPNRVLLYGDPAWCVQNDTSSFGSRH